ncbi:MAG: gamma-glutamylcyclotransferase, partial [Methanobrevibacter sp.]|nr:gamma-glutamylcyclotransferase [Methanobrevibacter sp.]
MTKLQLTKLNEPDFDKLYEMKSAIADFLNEDVDSENEEWMENLETILDFQDKDGSFKLFTTYKIPSDARVDFCHEPTYICTSILMKAYLLGDSALMEKVENPLIRGLEMSCMRNLTGHGYEGLKG